MSAIDVALASVFADPVLSGAGVYRAGGTGPGLPVRVIRLNAAASFNLAGTRFATDGTVLEVRAAEIPAPVEGDTIEIGGVAHRIQAAPLAKAGGLVWWLDVRAV